MFSFLRPLFTVILFAVIHGGMVIWCTFNRRSPSVLTADADPDTYQWLLDWLYFPISMFSGSVREHWELIDFAAFSLTYGLVGWMLLGTALAFLKKPKKGSRRSFIPSASVGKILCFALVGFLIFEWVTRRLLPLL
ncbi:MAG: hypothetical protein P8J27_06815 [Mariniblastus sp.]|nr:hypothetical protein [Mariniblastus sp.]